MRLLVRLGVGLIVLHLVVAAALLVLVPRYINEPEVHQIIADASAARLGRPLRFQKLDVGLLPPSLLVLSPTLAGRSEDDPPFLKADVVELRLGILPLLSGTLEIVSLVLEGVELTTIRDVEGLWLPLQTVQATTEPPASESDSGFAIAIRRVRLRDSRLVLIDRRVVPAVTSSFEAVSFSLSGKVSAEPLRIEGSARFAAGGELTLSGTTTLEGEADLRLELDDVSLRALEPYVGEDIRVAGTLDMSMHLSGQLAAPSGDFTFDATAASFDYAGLVQKPVGVPAKAEGRFEVSADGVMRVEVSSLLFHTMDASSSVELGDTLSLKLDAPRFDLAGIDILVPALADYPLSGAVSIEGLVVSLEPLSVQGVIQLEDTHVKLPEADGFSLRGKLVGRGDRLELEGVRVSAGGQQVAIWGHVTGLEGDLPFDFGLESVGVLRANAIFSSVSTLRDVVYGPFALSGRLSGRAAATGSESAVLDSLVGHGRFDLGKSVGEGNEGGRIEGLSILGQVMGEAARLGVLTKLASTLSGGAIPDLSSHTGDEFEHITGDFEIGDGLFRTNELRMLYRTYGVSLNGTVALGDQSLDMKGKLILGDEVVGAFGGGGESGGKKDKVVIPVAHVRGTLSAPEFGVNKKAFASLTTRLLLKNPLVDETLGMATREVEKVLPKRGTLLRKGLGALLGGGDGRKDAGKSEQ